MEKSSRGLIWGRTSLLFLGNLGNLPECRDIVWLYIYSSVLVTRDLEDI